MTNRLLNKVAGRKRVAEVGRIGTNGFFFVAVLYGCILAASRLLGLLPGDYLIEGLFLVPVLGLAGGLVWARRPDSEQAARLVDGAVHDKDLFLTAALIDHAVGAYTAVVVKQAEAAAVGLSAATVVPFHWQKSALRMALTFAIFFILASVLPQLDPFGSEAKRETVREENRAILATRKAIRLRREMVKKSLDAGIDRKNVKLALDQLSGDLKKMRPEARQENLKRLQDHQKDISQHWRKLGEKKLADALSKRPASQRFGGANSPKLDKLREQMKRGDLSGLQKELDALKKDAASLAKQGDSAASRKAARDLKKRMQALSQMMDSALNNRNLSNAMKTAMEQLSMGASQGMTSEMMKSLQESLSLSQMEMAQLAENIQNLKSLEQALKAIQMAKQVNQGNGLNGKDCKDCNGMADYADLYQKLMAAAKKGQGAGEGMKGKGTGKGGQAPEDESLTSTFKSERSKSALTAGKILMQWKTKGVSAPGAAQENYIQQMTKVKQGVSEAILSEEVPPGYHEAIKNYFDTIKTKP